MFKLSGNKILFYIIMVYMSHQDFIKEHKKLIPLLKKGSVSARMKEAKSQEKELLKVIKRYVK